MARFGNQGRFDHNYELDAIYEGMDRDLQKFAGQFIPWWRFDAENSVEDPIYDVGANTGGRRFKKPVIVPVISIDLQEGVEINTGEGQYTTDIAHLVVSYDAMEKVGLRNMAQKWREHYGDRFVYNGIVFQVRNIQIRGPVRERYEVLGIDGWQVNPEELVNDPDFAEYATMNAPLQVAAPEDQTPENDTALNTGTPNPVADDDLYGGPA